MVIKKCKGTCGKCGKVRKILAKGLCASCYNKRLTVNGSFMGRKVSTHIPLGDKEQATSFLQKEKERVLKDVIKNPGKWLDKVGEDNETN